MSSSEIKSKVQGAYSHAIANPRQWVSRSSSFPSQFRDLKLYGREAGVDFVETNLALIVGEAVTTAECKLTSLDVPLYGSGKAAIEGVAATLHDLTSLKVEIHQSTVKLIWAVPNPGLV